MSFDLYAVTGSTELPDGAVVPVWGYNSVNATVDRPGGPTLVVNEGDNVSITLHNELGEASGLLLKSQAMVPDLTGVADDGAGVYNFTASRPGTYLYEATPITDACHQPSTRWRWACTAH